MHVGMIKQGTLFRILPTPEKGFKGMRRAASNRKGDTDEISSQKKLKAEQIGLKMKGNKESTGLYNKGSK